jgi:hypothetical protein
MVLNLWTNDAIKDARSFGVDPSFGIKSVDQGRQQPTDSQTAGQKTLGVSRLPRPDLKEIITHPPPDPALGPVLGKFVGTFG